MRERLVEGLCRGQVDIDKVLLEFFSNLMAQTGTQREMQQRRDAWQSFQQHSGDWMRNVAEAWRSALTETPSSHRGSGFNASELSFELVDDDVVENKIVASRIALTVMEAVSAGFESLRLRVQSVEGRELPKDDILRPETVALHLVEQWVKSGMARDDLQTVLDPLQRELAAVLLKVYQACNDLLQSQGVVAQQDLRVRVNRSPAGSGAAPLQNSPASQALAQTQQAMASAREMAVQASRFGASRMAPTSMHPMQQAMPSMYAGASPLARARQRAQGVMVQLKRLLTQPATGFDMVNAPPASAALAHALAAHRVQAESYYGTVGAPIEDYSPAAVVQVTNVVRNRSAEFKKKADSEGEKAIIEVVALMFQSILTEDRIPPAVRIWFARLQVPVLRVALAEPEFFSNMEHPARKLIDRMGSVALGFDSTALSGSALEAEIKRIVQVIEQYPETGRRVFQLVFEEFKKFLGRALTEGGAAQQMASLAQQIEQKDALTVQYTIELRRMLEPVPVPEPVREFLFRVWSEVLAMAAVRRGPQAADTLRYKQAAADLLWVVSPKSERAERTRVVQQLPSLLHTLREGMEGLALGTADQDAHIKSINDAVVQAFVSRGEGLSPERLAELSRSLAGLEDVVTDDPQGDVLLDPGVIELMFGAEGDALEVIASGGSQPGDGMLHWAQELELGAWFSLDYQGSVSQVQYVWRSQRGQLHLFGDGAGKSYLVQTRRLASYLQAGLLVPVEDETLTVRATREALARLNAEPDRLLQ